MIELTELGRVLDENTIEPVEVGGELEKFIADHLQILIGQNFGVTCKVTIKK